MNVVIYCRISSDPTGQAAGVTRQRADAEKVAELRGWDIVDIIVENDVSAAGTKPRPGFDRVLQLLEDRHADGVIAWSLDRLTRNRRDTLRLLEVGQSAGSTIALVRGTDLDLSTPAGRMSADILASVARHEIEQKSDRQTRANAQAAAAGRPPRRRGFGYTEDSQLVHGEADALRQCYAKLLSGASITALADWLNDQGHTNTTGGRWQRTPLRSLLLNPRNAGIRRYRGRDIPGNWEPIVAVETYEAAAALLADPRRRTAPAELKRKHLLAGLAHCGKCGNQLTSHTRTRRGRSIRTYACAPGYHLARDAEPVDELVSRLFVAYLRRGQFDLSPDEPADVRAMRQEHRTLTARRERLAQDLVDGLDPALVVEAQRRIDSQLADLARQLIRAGRVSAASTVAAAPDPGQAWLDADLAVRRAVLAELLTVTLQPTTGGRRFDPASVDVAWRT